MIRDIWKKQTHYIACDLMRSIGLVTADSKECVSTA